MQRLIPFLMWLPLRRLRNQPGLALLSLLSVALTVGLISSISIFAQGVSYLMLDQELTALSEAVHRPPLALRFYFQTAGKKRLTMEAIRTLNHTFSDIVTTRSGLTVNTLITLILSPRIDMKIALDNISPGTPALYDEALDQDVNVVVLSDLEKQIDLLDGQPFQYAPMNPRLPVWLHERMSNEMGLQVGENYDLVARTGKRLPISIAGIWREGDPESIFWSGPHVPRKAAFFVTAEAYETYVQPLFATATLLTSWYIIPNEAELTLSHADSVTSGLTTVFRIADQILPTTRMDISPQESLNRYSQRKAALTTLLLSFSLPVLGLLCYFLFSLSTITAQFQQEEIAILVSRGASRPYLLGLAGLEMFILIILGTPLGLGLGYLLAKAIGATDTFLTFNPRLDFPATFREFDSRLLIGSLLLLTVARLIPAWQMGGRSMIIDLRERARPVAAHYLTKVIVDGFLILTTIYAYQQLQIRGQLGIIGWEPEGNPFRDPLLLLAPSFFLLTGTLLFVHLFPTLMWFLALPSRFLNVVTFYMGLRNLHRQSGQMSQIVFLITICMGFGGFYASLALSLDQWLLDRIYYQVGTDFRFKQGPPIPDFMGQVDPTQTTPWLLPISDYQNMPGVTYATRVGDFQARPHIAQRRGEVGRLLGVDRADFSQVAYFRPDFAEMSLGTLMNQLAVQPDGLLVSQQFLQHHQLRKGDRMILDVQIGTSQQIPFVVAGSYDYFPTVYPDEAEAFIGNLDYIFEQSQQGTFHHIWLTTEPDIDRDDLNPLLKGMGLWPTDRQEVNRLIALDAARIERVGLFGTLSVGFLTSAFLAGLGLLVYTTADLQRRIQQIGIMRALGVHTGHLIGMVSIEYLGAILYGVSSGTILSIMMSYLFVPFFRFSNEAALALPPFLPYIAWLEIGWLALVFGVTLIMAQIILLLFSMRHDIAQTLKLSHWD